MDRTVDRIFEDHRPFLNSKVIARRQVRRLVEKVYLKLNVEDKENKNSVINTVLESAPKRPDLNQILFVEKSMDHKHLLEEAPKSERSDTFSLPSGLNSARQDSETDEPEENENLENALESLDKVTVEKG